MSDEKQKEAIIGCLNMIAYGVAINDKESVRSYFEELNDLIIKFIE